MDRNTATSTKGNNQDQVEEVMFLSVPKVYRTKAAALVKHLHKNGVTWDDNGSVLINGKELKYSNIVDIVNSAVRNRKESSPPEGEREVIDFLKTKNTPKEVIGNRTWLRELNSNPDEYSESVYTAASPSFSTPEPGRKRKRVDKKSPPPPQGWIKM